MVTGTTSLKVYKVRNVSYQEKLVATNNIIFYILLFLNNTYVMIILNVYFYIDVLFTGKKCLNIMQNIQGIVSACKYYHPCYIIFKNFKRLKYLNNTI